MKAKITIFSLGLLCCVIFLFNSAPTKSLFSEIAVICVKSIAPSVFPFIVSSNILLAAVRSAPIKVKTVLIYVLGLFFGFPISVSFAAKLYARNEIGLNTYKKLVCCGGIPSIGFTIGMCGNRFGYEKAAYLYFITLASALLCSSFFPDDIRTNKIITSQQQDDASVLSELSVSIKDGILRTVIVCGYVGFFYVLSGIICRNLKNGYAVTLICGFLEFSTGCARGFLLNDVDSYILCAGVLSFSGISVFMQSITIEKENNATVIKTEYLVSRLVQGILSCVMAYTVYAYGFPSLILIFAITVASTCCSGVLQTINKNQLKNKPKHSIIN